MTDPNEPSTSPPPPLRPKQYMLHSVVRATHNRTARAALPQNPRRKQYVGPDQIRLMLGRPTVISEAQLARNIDDIRKKAAEHILELRTLDGKLVDLKTGEATSRETIPRTQPNFPLDSVARDQNFPGLNLTPPYLRDDLVPPEVLAPGQKPALFGHAEQVAEDAEAQELATEGTAAAIREEVAESGVLAETPDDRTHTRSGKKKKT